VVGKSFEAAVRLSVTAAQNWARIDGEYAGKGVDLLSLPWPSFLNVIYVWALEHQSEEEARKWLEKLDSPLPGQQARNTEPDANEIDQLKHL